MFTLLVFALGVLAGRIFTGVVPRAKGRAAACLLASMTCIASSVEVAAQGLEQRKYFGWLDIDPPTVEKPSKVRWRLAAEESVASRVVLLTLTMLTWRRAKPFFLLRDFRWKGSSRWISSSPTARSTASQPSPTLPAGRLSGPNKRYPSPAWNRRPGR